MGIVREEGYGEGEKGYGRDEGVWGGMRGWEEWYGYGTNIGGIL